MTDSYRFPIKPKRIESVPSPDIAIRILEDRRTGPIHGVAAGSYAEWVFSLALIYLKVRFVYKYTVRGTKFVIDFYVEAAGGWIPVDVRNYRSDVDSSAQRYRRKFIGRLLDRMLVTIWDYQLATFEEAVTVVRRLIA